MMTTTTQKLDMAILNDHNDDQYTKGTPFIPSSGHMYDK